MSGTGTVTSGSTTCASTEYRAHGPRTDALAARAFISSGNVGTAAQCIGVMRNIYELLKDWCNTRIVAGKPLKEHTITAAVLSDIVVAIETSRRAETYLKARMLDRPDVYGPRHTPEMLARTRVSKLYASDQLTLVANKALDLMGSFGYAREGDLESHWRTRRSSASGWAVAPSPSSTSPAGSSMRKPTDSVLERRSAAAAQALHDGHQFGRSEPFTMGSRKSCSSSAARITRSRRGRPSSCASSARMRRGCTPTSTRRCWSSPPRGAPPMTLLATCAAYAPARSRTAPR